MERGGDTAPVANTATQAFAAGLFVTDPPLHSNSLACFTGTTRRQPTVADMDMYPTRLRATRGRGTHALFSLIVHEARSLHPLSTRTRGMKEYAPLFPRASSYSVTRDSGITGGDSTPNPTLLARVACGPVLSFDSIIYMWRYVARSG